MQDLYHQPYVPFSFKRWCCEPARATTAAPRTILEPHGLGFRVQGFRVEVFIQGAGFWGPSSANFFLLSPVFRILGPQHPLCSCKPVSRLIFGAEAGVHLLGCQISDHFNFNDSRL